MMTMWRFVHTGNRTPAENMAIDEAMLTAHERGLVPPTVRFYGWNPATLSIGCFQHAAKEVDFTALREYGLGFVRRSTGGLPVDFAAGSSGPITAQASSEITSRDTDQASLAKRRHGFSNTP